MDPKKDLAWLQDKIDRRNESSRAMGVQLAIGHAERIAERLKEQDELIKGLFQELADTEAPLAEGCGYPYKEGYGWVVGDHTTVTLAMEAKDLVEDLAFMRGIAIDMHAMMSAGVQVPPGMLEAFADAIAYKHPKQSRQRRENGGTGDKAKGLTGVERPEGLGGGQPEAGE